MKKSIYWVAILAFLSIGITLYGGDKWEYSAQCSNAWKIEDYATAITAQKNKIAVTNNDSLEPDVNRASSYVTLAMLEWSAGNKENAKEAMLNAIQKMRTGEYLANTGCEQRAEIFYQKMCKDQLPAKFYYRDSYTYGVLGYIMEIPYAVFDKKAEELIERYSVLATYFGSMSQTYRMQGESQARMAKIYAKSEYQRVTNRSFSPDTPPAYGTEARKVWDACKRVYDIFK